MNIRGMDRNAAANNGEPRCRVIVVGASAGGMQACCSIFPGLPRDYPVPIVVVQHIHPGSGRYLGRGLQSVCALEVEVAEDKQPILPGRIYFAPCDYHLLIEREGTFSLSVDARVNHSRPSIDVLFESAARAWSIAVVGILLTGASRDGAEGLRAIKEAGGLSIVQDPKDAEYPVMPESALALSEPDRVLSIRNIGELLGELNHTIRRKDR